MLTEPGINIIENFFSKIVYWKYSYVWKYFCCLLMLSKNNHYRSPMRSIAKKKSTLEYPKN